MDGEYEVQEVLKETKGNVVGVRVLKQRKIVEGKPSSSFISVELKIRGRVLYVPVPAAVEMAEQLAEIKEVMSSAQAEAEEARKKILMGRLNRVLGKTGKTERDRAKPGYKDSAARKRVRGEQDRELRRSMKGRGG